MWFKQHTHTFRLEKNETKVYVCAEQIRPCTDYWLPSGCKQLINCGKFHVCKSFLYNVTHSEFSCRFSHNLLDVYNQQVAKQLSLEPLSKVHRKYVLLNRLPVVCTKYLTGTCLSAAGVCPYVHVCGDFVNGECKKSGGLCHFQHEEAFTGAVGQYLKTAYHFPDSHTLRKNTVYLPARQKKKVEKEFLLKCKLIIIYVCCL